MLSWFIVTQSKAYHILLQQVFVPDAEEDANNELANMFAEDAAAA